jgi:hypothetical protein
MLGSKAPVHIKVAIENTQLLSVHPCCRARTLRWQCAPHELFRTVPAPGKYAAPRIQPILVSKVNTVLQFALAGSCVSRQALGWPLDGLTDVLVLCTLAATAVSGLQYCRLHLAGKVM